MTGSLAGQDHHEVWKSSPVAPLHPLHSSFPYSFCSSLPLCSHFPFTPSSPSHRFGLFICHHFSLFLSVSLHPSLLHQLPSPARCSLCWADKARLGYSKSQRGRNKTPLLGFKSERCHPSTAGQLLFWNTLAGWWGGQLSGWLAGMLHGWVNS